MEGPEVLLSAEATQPMAIVLHELVTNASKYGALTTPHGRISVRWDWRRDGQAKERLLLEWIETGGPRRRRSRARRATAPAPSATSFPTNSAARSILPSMPTGVRCRIELPSKCIRSDTQPTNPHHGVGLRPITRCRVVSSVYRGERLVQDGCELPQ